MLGGGERKDMRKEETPLAPPSRWYPKRQRPHGERLNGGKGGKGGYTSRKDM